MRGHAIVNKCLFVQGELALAFGDLLSKLWTPRDTPVAPAIFKRKLADFAPQFSGYNQHDSQVSIPFDSNVCLVPPILSSACDKFLSCCMVQNRNSFLDPLWHME